MYVTISNDFLESLRDTYFDEGQKGVKGSLGYVGIDRIDKGSKSLKQWRSDNMFLTTDMTKNPSGEEIALDDLGDRAAFSRTDYILNIMYVTQSQLTIVITVDKTVAFTETGNFAFIADDGTGATNGKLLMTAWFETQREKKVPASGVGVPLKVEIKIDLLRGENTSYDDDFLPLSTTVGYAKALSTEVGAKGETDTLNRYRGQTNVVVVDFFGKPTIMFRESGPASRGTNRGWSVKRNSHVGLGNLGDDTSLSDKTKVAYPVKIEEGEFVPADSGDSLIAGILDSHGILTRSGEIFSLFGGMTFSDAVGTSIKVGSGGEFLTLAANNSVSVESTGKTIGHVISSTKALIQLTDNRDSSGKGVAGQKGLPGEKGIAGAAGGNGQKGLPGEKGIAGADAYS